MKQFPLGLKMAKEKEMRKLQKQVRVLRKQQQHYAEKVEELQAEAENVTGIIQYVHQKVNKAVTLIQKVVPELISSNLVEKMQKAEEEVRLEAKRVTKILE